MKKVVLILFFSMIISCSKPGEGPRYESARIEAERVIVAIRNYESSNGYVPKDLKNLSAKYFESKRVPSEIRAGSDRYFYEKKGEGEFTFIFSYTGPGKNYCEYVGDLSRGKWDCWGVY